ncbi:MAG: phosphoglycolate phosphatase [Candidatus Methanomethyliaceae archaeon]|nr:phosphoglycolate phosphatase [Candidatus Methanomethyliaceae archaeon]MCX8169722.1 phosphoglycolate phosphatase [Candidatus Methanomethyliaceae archaeon]MDW7971088.1 phosphoglycolate phosphatase [Nitrososphaerota archaeon]
MIRAVATDVDGTLTNYNDELYLEAISAIRALERKGIKVILCTGNALCVTKALARYIGCTGPTVSENGAVVEYKAKIRVIGRKNVGREALDELKKIFHEEIVESWSNAYRFVDIAIRRTIPFNEVDKIVKKVNGAKVLDSGFAYHITDESVDKGKGLLLALDLIGVRAEEVLGVGDSITDLEMLKVCGIRAAVANADLRIKEIADIVAEKEFGLGFAEIVNKIVKL